MPDCTPAQITYLERCRKSQDRCLDMATEALQLRLTILPKEWTHIARQLQAAVANQERAFRDQTLVPEQLDLNHPEEGK
jgi:hypothetical protein